MFEQKFVSMAVSEVDFPTWGDYRNLDNIATFKLSGHIGQLAWNKEEFLHAGTLFLDFFEENAQFKIEDEENGDNNDQDKVNAFRRLIEESKLVERDVFLNLLDEDWDTRHEHEEV